MMRSTSQRFRAAADMFDPRAKLLSSTFIELKLDYERVQKFAVGDYFHQVIRLREHFFFVYCYPRGRAHDLGADLQGQGVDLPLGLLFLTRSKNINPIFEAFVLGKEEDGSTSKSHAKTTTKMLTSTVDGARYTSLPTFLKQSDLESLCAANGGPVTIACGVILPNDGNPITVPASEIFNNLGHMLDCADGSDVSFSVGAETFHAHRAWLAARSPVFRAELFGSMAEARQACIAVHDIEPSIFKALLHFAYKDTLPADPDLWDSPIDACQHLLAAADRYAFDRLKLICASKLWEIVSVDTVALILTCAETYSCQELKDNCMDFLVAEKNYMKATLTEGYRQLVLKFPSIMAELRERAGI